MPNVLVEPRCATQGRDAQHGRGARRGPASHSVGSNAKLGTAWARYVADAGMRQIGQIAIFEYDANVCPQQCPSWRGPPAFRSLLSSCASDLARSSNSHGPSTPEAALNRWASARQSLASCHSGRATSPTRLSSDRATTSTSSAWGKARSAAISSVVDRDMLAREERA